MKPLTSLLSIALFTVSLGAGAQDTRGSKDEAMAMAKAAVTHVKQVGADQAWKDFTDAGNAEWHKKDLYVFVNRFDGMTLAHGANVKLVGKDMSGLKDQDGKPFIVEMGKLARSAGSGWVEYSWIHPETKKPAAKATYVVAVPSVDGYLGVGIYR